MATNLLYKTIILFKLFFILSLYSIAQTDSESVEQIRTRIRHEIDSLTNVLSSNDILLSKSYFEILKDHSTDNTVYFRKRAYEDLNSLSRKYQKQFSYSKVIDSYFYAIPKLFDSAYSDLIDNIHEINETKALLTIHQIYHESNRIAQENLKKAEEAAYQERVRNQIIINRRIKDSTKNLIKK